MFLLPDDFVTFAVKFVIKEKLQCLCMLLIIGLRKIGQTIK